MFFQEPPVLSIEAASLEARLVFEIHALNHHLAPRDNIVPCEIDERTKFFEYSHNTKSVAQLTAELLGLRHAARDQYASYKHRLEEVMSVELPLDRTMIGFDLDGFLMIKKQLHGLQFHIIMADKLIAESLEQT